ncbi:MAG: hypothetical protein RLZZ387_3058 [Chloroflexota bacterium]|jgi:hypothetical protein
MGQSYTKVTHTSWGGKIMNSFVGALIGALLFLGSFVLLWVNEGRTDWSVVARGSTAVEASAVDRGAEGKFVSVSGPLSAAEPLGDEPYLKPGAYVNLQRVVEMYAWEEQSSSETRDNIGGGSTTTTTYTYSKKWTSSPANSSGFEVPAGHENPPLSVEGRDLRAAQLSVGAYQLVAAEIGLPGGQELRLTPEMVTPVEGARLEGKYIFQGLGTPQSPQVGDVRISYRALPVGAQVTAFGTLEGDTVAPYLHRGEDVFYRAVEGGRANAIESLHTEFVVIGWILRLVGFLMMWIGLSMVFGPITAFLDVLPILGDISGFAISVVTFVAAAILSIITIVIAVLAHNLLALIVVLLLVAGGVYAWGLSKRGAISARTSGSTSKP